MIAIIWLTSSNTQMLLMTFMATTLIKSFEVKAFNLHQLFGQVCWKL